MANKEDLDEFLRRAQLDPSARPIRAVKNLGKA